MIIAKRGDNAVIVSQDCFVNAKQARLLKTNGFECYIAKFKNLNQVNIKKIILDDFLLRFWMGSGEIKRLEV